MRSLFFLVDILKKIQYNISIESNSLIIEYERKGKSGSKV